MEILKITVWIFLLNFYKFHNQENFLIFLFFISPPIVNMATVRKNPETEILFFLYIFLLKENFVCLSYLAVLINLFCFLLLRLSLGGKNRYFLCAHQKLIISFFHLHSCLQFVEAKKRTRKFSIFFKRNFSSERSKKYAGGAECLSGEEVFMTISNVGKGKSIFRMGF